MDNTSQATTLASIASDKYKIEEKYRAIIENSRQQAELARKQTEDLALSRARNLQQNLASRGLLGTGVQQLGDVQNQILLSGELNKQALSSAASESQLMYQMMSEKDAVNQNYSDLKKNIQGTALSLASSSMNEQDVKDLVTNLFNTYGYAPESNDIQNISSVVSRYISSHPTELADSSADVSSVLSIIQRLKTISTSSTDEAIKTAINDVLTSSNGTLSEDQISSLVRIYRGSGVSGGVVDTTAAPIVTTQTKFSDFEAVYKNSTSNLFGVGDITEKLATTKFGDFFTSKSSAAITTDGDSLTGFTYNYGKDSVSIDTNDINALKNDAYGAGLTDEQRRQIALEYAIYKVYKRYFGDSGLFPEISNILQFTQEKLNISYSKKSAMPIVPYLTKTSSGEWRLQFNVIKNGVVNQKGSFKDAVKDYFGN